ncbi:hypothetical protein LF887_04395 [Chryseobacterium sp. MEBOG06]|uniref:hypothetical protein n=1 Tax=Chryseobacterium sp. MEBOG06 TaxID=2879938 RepID=UPI001F2E385B|nr:hypothetical protein [Chryseobacterium sp. MEBOG06]UKB84879.1 hypothetical protein LF887_04395 [Chryseobacterium sp. MEBOG06]
MILILSEKFDIPTQNIITKLDNYNAKYRVIYGSDLLEKSFFIDVNQKYIYFDDEVIADITVVWYRRWLSYKFVFSQNPDEDRYLREEFESLSSYFMNNITSKRWINTPPFIQPYPSKSTQLQKAVQAGLNIPNSIVTNSKLFLNEFYESNKRSIITKNLNNPYFFEKGNEILGTYTTIIDDEDVKRQDNIYFPSLFQNNIIKDFEIRIFYFLETIYSYAIFSSNNSKTNTDFRLYDFNKPNRIMKCELPNEIELSLIKFMKSLNLHTGSIDMIRDISNNYYFLEVNPQGQFGGLEEYGLFIEEDIVKYLMFQH